MLLMLSNVDAMLGRFATYPPAVLMPVAIEGRLPA